MIENYKNVSSSKAHEWAHYQLIQFKNEHHRKFIQQYTGKHNDKAKSHGGSMYVKAKTQWIKLVPTIQTKLLIVRQTSKPVLAMNSAY